MDRGVSGAREKRPALDRLMADANRGAFQVIAVWKLDRFGRSLRHLVNALAEFERALIAERVRAGLAVARAKGKRLGRKPRTDVDSARIAALRAQGRSWREIAAEMKAGLGTIYRIAKG